MNQYYHPSSEPNWVNDDWLRANTTWDPADTPLEVLAENGFYEVKYDIPSDHSPDLYEFVWSYSVVSPYCIWVVSEFTPKPFDEAKAWMLANYPDYADQINLATTVDQLQDILNSIPGT